MSLLGLCAKVVTFSCKSHQVKRALLYSKRQHIVRFRPFLFLFLKRTSAVLTFWNCMTPSVSTSGTYFPRNGDVILQMIAIIVSTTETIVKWRGIACVQWKMPRNYLLCFTSLSLKGSDFFFRLFGSPFRFCVLSLPVSVPTRSFFQFLYHEVTKSIRTPPWMKCQSISGFVTLSNIPLSLSVW